MSTKRKRRHYGSYPVQPPVDNNPPFVATWFQRPEATPLLQEEPTYRRMSATRFVQVGGWCLILVVLSFMLYQTSMHFVHCPLDASTRDSIRLDWEKDTRQHTALEREWQSKAEEQAEIEQGWKRETKQHEANVARRIHEEDLRQARVREVWTHEMEQHAREFAEMQRRERHERERERQEWQREMEKHARDFEQMKRREMEEWEQEQEKRQREAEEREQREEEERQRLHMYWGHVEVHACTTYATREYSAQLMNLPRSWRHPLEACKNTPLEIHGTSQFPTTCEDRGSGVMIGRWANNQQEPDCTPFWDEYNDKGCTSPGSGRKRITHKLMNLPEGGDWRVFCATTPITFDHMYFPGAEECFTSVFGVYGQWEMDDSKC